MNSKTKYLIVVIAAWTGYAIWEYYVHQWAAAQPPGGGAVIRVDLVLLLPVLLAITALSLQKIFKKDKPVDKT